MQINRGANVQDLYPSNETYSRLVEALATLQDKPCPVTGRVEPYQIIEVLGEVGGIWPASVLDDPENMIIGAAA